MFRGILGAREYLQNGGYLASLHGVMVPAGA
jgi:hypothetical protein